MNRWVRLIALAGCLPIAAAAQDTTSVRAADTDSTLPPKVAPTVTLSLAEAIDRARGNSPIYRQTLNNAGPARWGVRNAYGSFLPSVTASADANNGAVRCSAVPASARPRCDRRARI